jgi:AcrR family transcriptional regulator
MTSSPTRSYDASGRQAAAEERRRRVVDVAHELFLREGYGPTSIATIAEAAGVSAPFVYASFGSKAGILDVLAGVAVAGDHEEGLVRDREESQIVLNARDLREWIDLGSHWTRVTNERSAPIMHVVQTVSGSDPAVAELLAKLVAGRRSDLALTVVRRPGMRDDLEVADLMDTVDALTHWETWWTLRKVAGWTPERYEAWLNEVLSSYALAEKAS